MRERTRLTRANIDVFVRRFLKQIPAEQLQPIPTGLYGASFVFRYGTDKILKINKVNQRGALLKEAGLATFLSTQNLPVRVVAPLEVHPRGLYAIYPRLAARSLTPDMLRGFTDDQMTAFAAAVGGFLSVLHSANVPPDVAVPRGEEDLETMLAQCDARIDFIELHAPEADTVRLRQQLAPFRGTMRQQWAVNHADLGFGNIMLNDGEPQEFSIIDFNDAEVCDASMDFDIMAEDLEDEGLNAHEIMQAVLANYDTEDGTMCEKMSFRKVLREIGGLFRRVRQDVRRAATLVTGQ